MTTTQELDFTVLTEDGDTLDLSDTQRLVLHVSVDEEASINDYDGDGKVSGAHDYHDNAQRPDGFTGRAMKIQVDRGCWVWWEPYDDVMGYTENGETKWAKWGQLPANVRMDNMRRIQNLLECGFMVVTLAMEELVNDSRGGEHWVEVSSTSLGGCDSIYDGLVEELYNEIL